MMKQALRSYLASIHPRNVKKLREINAYGYVHLFICGLYAFVALLPGKTVNDWIFSFIFLMFPIFFMFWSDMSSRYLMPKAMFLCPMKEEERKEYIQCVLKCKITGPLIFGFFIHLIWSIDYGFQIWRLATLLFLYYSAGIALYMGYEYRVKSGEKVPWVTCDAEGKKIYPRLRDILIPVVIAGITMVCAFDYASDPIMTENVFPYFIIVASVLLFVIAALDIIIIRKQLPYVTENIGDYEKNFKIQVKKTAPQKYVIGKK